MRKLEKELEELKSILPLLATTSEREAAAKLAHEIHEKGFSEHSAEEVRKILQGHRGPCQKMFEDAEEATGESMTASSANEMDPLAQPPFQPFFPEYTEKLPITHDQNSEVRMRLICVVLLFCLAKMSSTLS